MKLLLRLLLSLGHVAVASGYGPSSPSPATIALTIRTSPPVDLPPPLRLTASSPPRSLTSLSSYSSTSTSSSGTSTTRDATTSTTRSPRYPGRSRTLGLLTFDLDDSLYPIGPVLSDANSAFSSILSGFGYSSSDIGHEDVVESGRRIREEAGPIVGSAMTHTEVRMRAIRREMER